MFHYSCTWNALLTSTISWWCLCNVHMTMSVEIWTLVEHRVQYNFIRNCKFLFWKMSNHIIKSLYLIYLPRMWIRMCGLDIWFRNGCECRTMMTSISQHPHLDCKSIFCTNWEPMSESIVSERRSNGPYVHRRYINCHLKCLQCPEKWLKVRQMPRELQVCS